MQQSRPRLWRALFVAAALIVVLPLAWLGPLDQVGERYVEEGLKRALVTFATARTANAVISVVKSTTVSVPIIGGVTASPGQLLDPIDQLIEQFSTLMLAACISLAAQRLLIAAGGLPAVSAGLTVLLLAWAWLTLRGGDHPRFIRTLLVITLFVRFAVPIASFGSEATFNAVMSTSYSSSEAQVKSTSDALSGTANELASSPSKITQAAKLMDEFKARIDNAVRHVVTLMAIFVLQTLVLPLVFLWITFRLFGIAFNWRPVLRLRRREGTATGGDARLS